MVVILKRNPDKTQLKSLMSWLESKGISVQTTVGASQTILGLVGDTSALDIDLIAALDIVEAVRRVQEPYKSANRKFHPADTVIRVGNDRRKRPCAESGARLGRERGADLLFGGGA